MRGRDLDVLIVWRYNFTAVVPEPHILASEGERLAPEGAPRAGGADAAWIDG